MNLRLKTSLSVETKLNELQGLLQVSSRAAIMRIAIAFSIKDGTDPRMFNGIYLQYNVHKQNGTDYNRYTIFGDDEMFYKLQMEQSLRIHLDDDSFFPELTNAHITRGIDELYAEFKLAGSREKFIRKIIK